MEKIVFLERNTFNVEFRRLGFDHEWIEYRETKPSEVVDRLRDATVVIANKLALREKDLSQLPGLKLIAIAATGTDNVDLAFCRSHGITVCNTRHYAVHSVAEHVLMLILALRRNLINYREDVRRGKWQEAKQFCLLDHPIRDLYGSSIGIIGYGFLGQAVASLAQALGIKAVIAEHKNATTIREGRIAFPDVLRQCDVITLHCPLTEETRNLFGADEFQMMKPEALLINTARGELVDEAALVNALKNGEIGGAGIDVVREEPPREGTVLPGLELPNLIVTPHIGWASREAMQTLADQVIDNIEAFVRGEPRNLVV